MEGLGVIPGTTGAVDYTSAFPIAGSTGAAYGTGTGQHGIAPSIGAGGTMSDGINAVWQWLNTPFSSQMSMLNIFLIVGVILIAIIAWNLILYHVRIAAETL